MYVEVVEVIMQSTGKRKLPGGRRCYALWLASYKRWWAICCLMILAAIIISSLSLASHGWMDDGPWLENIFH
jgi:hypothetical protein